MAKGQSETSVDQPKAEVAKEAAVSLDEFCMRLSKDDRRVESIGAFHHDEKKMGRIKDTEGNFRSRFDAFLKRPA